MNDLNGLDWSASANQAPAKGASNYYPTLRPTPPPPFSARAIPLSAQGSATSRPPAKPATDSFSNLVSFGSAKSANKLTLQQQQEKLQEEKRKKEEERRKQYDSQFGNLQYLDALGNKSSIAPPATSRTATPTIPPSLNIAQSISGTASPAANNDDEDLFAAFNSETKVDNSSHYPPPPVSSNGRSTPAAQPKIDLSNPSAWNQPASSSSAFADLGDDDDPFGLGQLKQKAAAPQTSFSNDDDDFLGDLGKPVEQVKRQAKASTPVPPPQTSQETLPDSDDPWDKAVAELVDMGFSAENSRRALTENGAGLNVQAAVGWLLNDAHRQAKEKSQSRPSSTRPDQFEGSRANGQREGSTNRSNQKPIPAWARDASRDSSRNGRQETRSPANGEVDLSKAAAAVGKNLFKTANSLWKTTQKSAQKAVAELQQQDSDPSQPKWMRDSSNDRQQPARKQAQPDVTDEALMLEAGGRPQPRRAKPPPDQRYPPSSSTSRDQSPMPSNASSGRSSVPPKWQSTAAPVSRISKQAIEEQSAQAYISPARRKKTAPPSQPKPTEGDLLFGTTSSSISHNPPPASAPPTSVSRAPPRQTPQPMPSKPSTPIAVRPKAPPRNIPSLSPSALATSTQHRLAGTVHFKRGDYASAHTSYSTSLSALPPSHPITIVLLCNRALTFLKIGEPKNSVSDADSALKLIGPSRGENESIDLSGSGDDKKDMKEFWGKALMRKAEALEQMERWADALGVWKEAVEGGVGGGTAIQGRQRCEKALAPKPAKPAAVARPAAPKPKPSAMNDLGPSRADNSAAVNRVRAAAAAAEKEDDEKFALADEVSERIAKWREGKADNLRALLTGMDAVLWEGSGWKKVGLGELVVNNKVKIIYMKAIGKVHPDKLPQDATTEQKMISSSVFATLNEAWDKFKESNGM